MSTEKFTDKKRWVESQKLKDRVVKAIGKQDDYHKRLKDIKTNPVVNPTKMKEVKRILTGTALDRLFSKKGGIEAGSSMELFGIFGSGKSQTVMALAAEAIREGSAIYIDSEHTFRTSRFREICETRGIDPDEYGDRLLLYQPDDWVEQEAVTTQLPEFDRDDNFLDVRIVIVDSLMKHWAAAPEFYGRDKLTYRQQLVRAQEDRLSKYVRRHGGVLVYTNQVYDKPVDTSFAPPESKIGSRGGRTVEHLGDIRIFLRKGRGNIRFARLVDNLELPLMEIPFVLDASGIGDIGDPVERVKAVMKGEEYLGKFLSEQVGMKAAGKEFKMEALKRGSITVEEAKVLKLTDKEIEKALKARDEEGLELGLDIEKPEVEEPKVEIEEDTVEGNTE